MFNFKQIELKKPTKTLVFVSTIHICMSVAIQYLESFEVKNVSNVLLQIVVKCNTASIFLFLSQ